MSTLLHFFYMDGYGFYIFSAYSSVTAFLFIQWLLPWCRWRKYLRKQPSS
ncbi:MAG TPA: hypothetical protein VJN02_08070 [Gammaproteobacteria bacterium]|nr:hypothetical protein [Gammaproteobacteria bacterium]